MATLARDDSAPATVPSRQPRHPRRLPLLLGLIAGAAVLLGVCVLSIAVGSWSIPVGVTWELLWRDDGSDLANIVHALRLPRTLLGLLVGVCLGLSGVVMQALTLNPLAD